ncbi:MAG: hypothetical protein JWP63_5317 [Candidatus Solibacter sp.]|nr:hypothetical protein [Candidatus Solibacter sp.]
MWKCLLALAFLSVAAWAANLKLYMKDGSYHIVREYQVQPDRVHFYSIERSDWEDLPLELVDLKRTETEAAARQTKLMEDAKVMAEEEKAERELEKEKRRIPQDPGVYWMLGTEVQVMKAAESTVHTNKGRSILKRLAPVPIVSGKATLELGGAHSLNVFDNPEQEFYIQLTEPERFGIAKLTTKGAVRIVENLTTLPVVNEVEEELTMVDILKKELDGGLYKIWPLAKLPPGEYAVVEYTAGKMNIQVWDFAIKAK